MKIGRGKGGGGWGNEEGGGVWGGARGEKGDAERGMTLA